MKNTSVNSRKTASTSASSDDFTDNVAFVVQNPACACSQLSSCRLLAAHRVKLLLNNKCLSSLVTKYELVDVNTLQSALNSQVPDFDNNAYTLAFFMLNCMSRRHLCDVDSQIVNQIVCNAQALNSACNGALEFLHCVCIWVIETRRGSNLVHLAHELLLVAAESCSWFRLYVEKALINGLSSRHGKGGDDPSNIYWRLRELQKAIHLNLLGAKEHQKVARICLELYAEYGKVNIYIANEIACLVAQLRICGVLLPNLPIELGIAAYQKLTRAGRFNVADFLTVEEIVRVAVFCGNVTNRKAAIASLGNLGARVARNAAFKLAARWLLKYRENSKRRVRIGYNAGSTKLCTSVDFGILTVAALQLRSGVRVFKSKCFKLIWNIIAPGLSPCLLSVCLRRLLMGYGCSSVVSIQLRASKHCMAICSLLNAATASVLKCGTPALPNAWEAKLLTLLASLDVSAHTCYHQWLLDHIKAMKPKHLQSILLLLVGYCSQFNGHVVALQRLWTFTSMVVGVAVKVIVLPSKIYSSVLHTFIEKIETFGPYHHCLNALAQVFKCHPAGSGGVAWRLLNSSLENMDRLSDATLTFELSMAQVALAKIALHIAQYRKLDAGVISKLVGQCVGNVEALKKVFGLLALQCRIGTSTTLYTIFHILIWQEPCYSWDLETLDAYISLLRRYKQRTRRRARIVKPSRADARLRLQMKQAREIYKYTLQTSAATAQFPQLLGKDMEVLPGVIGGVHADCPGE